MEALFEMSSTDTNLRYARQMLLPDFGQAAQQKLGRAKVLVIGAGGLGCAALQYLAAAGIGHLSLIDFDVVELTNLQRQVLYSVDDIGQPKVHVTAKKLKALNPEISISAYCERLTTANALELIAAQDVVIDGSDNFTTRYLVNDACVILNKPLVYGAVLRYEGQVGVFNVPDKKTGLNTNYRDLFPKAPESSQQLSCSEAGVLGVLPGMIGILQATEAIKVITGIGEILNNQILSYNVLNTSFYTIALSVSNQKESSFPKTESEFLKFDYAAACEGEEVVREISVEDFEKIRNLNDPLVIDVREAGELPEVDEFIAMPLPLSQLKEEVKTISVKKPILLFCQSGQRSKEAARLISKAFPEAEVYSLKGGIKAWKNKTYN